MNPQLCRFIWNLNLLENIFVTFLSENCDFLVIPQRKGNAYLLSAYLLIEQTRRGYRGAGEREKVGAGEGRKGSGRREKGGGRKGGGRRENRRAGERVREKGERDPLYPSQQAYHKEWPYG